MIAILLAGIVVLAVLSVSSVGSGRETETPADGRLDVNDGVTARLPAGWQLVERFDDGVRVGQGGTTADILVRDAGDPAAALQAYVDEVLVPDATVFSSTDPVAADVNGRPGARASYVGRFTNVPSSLEGRLVAVSYDERSVVVDAWAAEGRLGSADSQIEELVASIEVAE